MAVQQAGAAGKTFAFYLLSVAAPPGVFTCAKENCSQLGGQRPCLKSDRKLHAGYYFGIEKLPCAAFHACLCLWNRAAYFLRFGTS